MTKHSNPLLWVEKIEERSGSWGYTLPLHVEYQTSQYTQIKAFDQTKLKFPAGLMDLWDERLGREVKVNKTIAESAFVKQLEELDRQRDEVVSGIFSVVRGSTRSRTKAKAEAARHLARVLKPYASTQKASFDEETANLRGLKDEVSTLAADITTLGLTNEFADLFALNESFASLRRQRQLEEPSGDLPTSRLARAETEEVYDVVCHYIEAAFLHAATDEDRQAIATLIHDLNKMTAFYKATKNKKDAQRKPSDPKKPKDPKDPKDPKQPKDPKKPEGGGDDIHLPEEPPKKPDDAEQPKPNPGGGGDDIQIPSEPPKKPEGGQ